MLKTDKFGNLRFYVRGEREDCERFTINLAWYHSALAEIGSFVVRGDGIVTLNLVVKQDDVEDDLRKLAYKFNVKGFASFDELKD
jgi:hypothetical protein